MWRWQSFMAGRRRGWRKQAVHMHTFVRPAQGPPKEEDHGHVVVVSYATAQ